MSEPGWSVNVKNVSSASLMELYQLLKASDDNREQAREIQRELVSRARAAGMKTRDIMRVLVAGVTRKRERAVIAKEWCNALGLQENEARRLVG